MLKNHFNGSECKEFPHFRRKEVVVKSTRYDFEVPHLILLDMERGSFRPPGWKDPQEQRLQDRRQKRNPGITDLSVQSPASELALGSVIAASPQQMRNATNSQYTPFRACFENHVKDQLLTCFDDGSRQMALEYT